MVQKLVPSLVIVEMLLTLRVFFVACRGLNIDTIRLANIVSGIEGLSKSVLCSINEILQWCTM
jgi:hypothetical protein